MTGYYLRVLSAVPVYSRSCKHISCNSYINPNVLAYHLPGADPLPPPSSPLLHPLPLHPPSLIPPWDLRLTTPDHIHYCLLMSNVTRTAEPTGHFLAKLGRLLGSILLLSRGIPLHLIFLTEEERIGSIQEQVLWEEDMEQMEEKMCENKLSLWDHIAQ